MAKQPMSLHKKLWIKISVGIFVVTLVVLGIDWEEKVEGLSVPMPVITAVWAATITSGLFLFGDDILRVLRWLKIIRPKKTPQNQPPRGTIEFKEDKGRGDLAAPLIRSADNLADAIAIFNHCRYDKKPRALSVAKDAMVSRLIREGRTEQSMRFLKSENLRTYYTAITTPPKKGYTDGLYFGLVMEFQLKDKGYING